MTPQEIVIKEEVISDHLAAEMILEETTGTEIDVLLGLDQIHQTTTIDMVEVVVAATEVAVKIGFMDGVQEEFVKNQTHSKEKKTHQPTQKLILTRLVCLFEEIYYSKF